MKYVGNGNDRDPILVAIGDRLERIRSREIWTDVNLDGVVRYIPGADNDRDPIPVEHRWQQPTAVRLE
ncbi:MAG: hypothetical protein IPF41_17415 [Flavobacteriales bacterium]|nr:hypothetical protein [Flavobacteriales bacterium]